MKTKTKTDEAGYEVDRTGWDSGPWDGEPDRVQWRTRAGLLGLIVRNDQGALCGYAAVPRGHALHGADYDVVDVSVHGGLTYADSCAGYICHVPELGESDDVFWFGFDCAHCYDVRPGDAKWRREIGLPVRAFPGERVVYRTVDYVREQVEALAEQLASLSERGHAAPRPGGAT